eukprot:TRINITY_DN1313_c0_g1_i1.p1 TRINITY_DN1313_c0_g1~~TRINITY_DN1313_c0_g1_i1.p1  ORF type:complete len:174 (+),score=38.74 TRINITY_DN1313_c0_g1_i1:194-715(+)
MAWSGADISSLVIAIAIPVVISFIIGNAIGGGDSEWYKALNKPSFTPPGWVFPIVWVTLYFMMGTASWIVWKDGGFEGHSFALSLYAIQLFLNFIWSPLFFASHQIGWALAEIILLLLSVVATTFSFYSVSAAAGILLIPYILWLCLAMTLNYLIFVNNPSGGMAVSASLLSE